MKSVSAIVCVDKKFGIAKKGVIPWHISNDLKFFKQKTIGKHVFMGRKTFESLPSVLKDRHVHVLSKSNKTDILEYNSSEELIIAGGEEIYKYFMDTNRLTKIYITVIDKDYQCDKFFPKIPSCYVLSEYSEKYYDENENVYYRFLTYEKRDRVITCEKEYNKLCYKIISSSKSIRNDRTGTGTYSSFGNKMEFDISKYAPVLTAKRVAWKSCIIELLWFLRGSTNVNELVDSGCKIWNGNTTTEYKKSVNLEHLKPEDCGPIYGFNWRHFGAEYTDCHADYTNKGFDQINYIINEIKNNPTSRRLILSGWDPNKIFEGVLPPCHMTAQFYVNGNKLSCQMYQRSADFFLGVPFNMLSYTVLTHIIAMKTDLVPDKLIMIFGDTHIYTDHINQVMEQLERSARTQPILTIDKSIKDKSFEEMDINDFDLIGYFPHPVIKANMSA